MHRGIEELVGGHELSAVRELRTLYGLPDRDEMIEDEHHFAYHRAGISMMSRRCLIEAIFLFGTEQDGFSRYYGLLPCGIRMDDSEKDVLGRIARAPSSRGSADNLPFPGKSESHWLAFTMQSYCMHIEFPTERRERIRMITLMARDPIREARN